MLDALRIEIERTGTGIRKLLGARADVPEGLTLNVVTSWLDGRVRSARKEHYDYLIACYREAPRHLEITDELRRELSDHRARTGIGPAVLLNGAPDIPEGLNVGIIESWFSGICGKALEAHLRFVLGRYQAWPSKDETGLRRFPPS